MSDSKLEITWANEELLLLPERALWWPREKTMFIADPHFGKASTFRAFGIAVPETSHDDDLNRLENIIARHQAKRLVILGDFLHAKSGRSESTLAALEGWCQKHRGTEVILVIGNHDRHAGSPPAEWCIHCVKEPFELAPFSCFHHPPENPTTGFALAGHLHPAFRLSERVGVSSTSVCFHFGKHVAVLPAFGNFTGKYVLEPTVQGRIFLVSESHVIEATKLLRR